MNAAIIVAAGSGQRFGSDIPKQFLKIKDRTVLEWTIGRFQAAPSVHAIVVVVAEDVVEKSKELLARFPKVTNIVAGGPTRADSVKNGLNAVPADSEVVAVHDGARPLVSADEIERTIAQARKTGAACLVGPVTDTIKSIRGGEIAATLDRNKLRRALTPQAFRTDVLRRAFEMADLSDSVTDECYLVEQLGHPIAIVEGRAINIKITHPEDIILAGALMNSEGEDAVPIKSGG